jgi:hypothetical protein
MTGRDEEGIGHRKREHRLDGIWRMVTDRRWFLGISYQCKSVQSVKSVFKNSDLPSDNGAKSLIMSGNERNLLTKNLLIGFRY